MLSTAALSRAGSDVTPCSTLRWPGGYQVPKTAARVPGGIFFRYSIA